MDSLVGAANYRTPHKELTLPSGPTARCSQVKTRPAYFSPFFGFADYKVGVSGGGAGVAVVGGCVGPL